MAEYRSAVPAWRVELDGEDLTATLAPRLLSLELSEKRGEEADELSIEVHDHDGKLAIPKAGAVLTVSLGWSRGSDVPPGLIEKGRFKVDEVEYAGPPDKVSIRARAADLGSAYRTRRDRSWKDRTIGQIVGEVASANGLTANVHASLASIVVPMKEQAQTSDMAFVRDLGRRYDAVATVKAGKLIFAPIGATTTAGGKAIAGVTIRRGECQDYRFRRAERGRNYDGVEARWHDQGAGARKTAKVGGDKRKRLKKTYANQHDAEAAAKAEHGRIGRAAGEFECTLALGRPDFFPGRKVTLAGWKGEIDGERWTIAEVSHSMSSSGLSTRLKLERL